jgi:nucleotide-binding universal stress UspA family protein
MAAEAQDVAAVAAERARRIFDRVLVGVDGSPGALEAVRQAARLIDPLGTLTPLAVWNVPPPTVAITGPTYSHERESHLYRVPAENVAAAAREAALGVGHVTAKVARGVAWQELLSEAEAEGATLVAVGSRGSSRAKGIVLGSTPTELVHKVHCSVLVARAGAERFPQGIVAGVDGSPESAVAFAIARSLAERFDTDLECVVAHGGREVDPEAVRAIAGPWQTDMPEHPVAALVAASTHADLVVVGSRGLSGVRAVGSVSERVAHRAHCSTLIVRAAGV